MTLAPPDSGASHTTLMNEPGVPSEKSVDAASFTNWVKRTLTIRDVPGYAEQVAFGTASIAFVLLVWWLLTRGEGDERIVDVYTLPSLRDTLASFRSLWFDRELSLSALTSLARVLGGFCVAAAVGVPLGLIAGSYLRVNAFLKPLVLFGRNVPVAALIPLTLVWFGLGEVHKVMFIFLASVAFVFFDTTTSVQAVPDRFLDTAYTLGAHGSRQKGVRFAALAGLIYATIIAIGWHWLREDETRTLAVELSSSGFWLRFVGGFAAGFVLWFPIMGHQVLRKVVLPLAMPDIVNSLRLIFGLAFGYIMLAEVINPGHGLGSLIIMSQRQGPREHIYLCLIIISMLAWGIDRGIMALQRHLFPYLKNAEA
jgi:ABC-type nitrate/sulfonate/bicarbonate transport system permease component